MWSRWEVNKRLFDFRTNLILQRLVHNMYIDIIPVLEDNYSYLVYDQQTKDGMYMSEYRFTNDKTTLYLLGFVVDPSDAQKVLDRVQKLEIRVKMILTTHHHWDHAAGNGQMKKGAPDATVIGGDSRVDHLDRLVQHEEVWQVTLKIQQI
jgi:hydroxyacylglutathione hydrolase